MYKKKKPEKSFKRKVKKDFSRKVKKNFTRSYKPKCYVCCKVLQDLIDLKWHKDKERTDSDHYVRLTKRINEKIVTIQSPLHPEGAMYRHKHPNCEAGGRNWMKREELVKDYEANMGIKLTKTEEEE